MSFFDQVKAGLKKATDRLTGEYGELTVEAPQGVRCGAAFTARLRLTARAALKVQKLRLRLEEFEHLDFTDYSERTDEHGKVWQQRAHGQFYAEKCLQELVLAQNLELAAGQSYDGEVDLTVPADARPTYEGRWFRHSFKVEVVAEIPWGVDLEQRVVFPVAPESPETLPTEGLLRSVESVEAELCVRPKTEEEGDWTPLAGRWVQDVRESPAPTPPPHWGPAYTGQRCKHERFLGEQPL